MDVELLGLGGALGRGQLLKWRQNLDLVNPNVFMLKVVIHIFKMAAMPFPCNGILLFVGNLPRIFPMPSSS